MKLDSKIVSLVVVLILLTGFVAFVGYRSLSVVVGGVAKADDVNSLVENLLWVRQQEKNFIILGDRLYANNVRENVEKLKKRTVLVKNKFDRKKSKEQMDLVSKQLSAYEAAFAAYDDLESRKNETMMMMEEKARTAMAKLEDIKADQETQLVKTREEMEAFLGETLEIVDDANLVIKHSLEARLSEKDYMLTENKEAFEQAVETINIIFDIIDRMLPRLTEDADKQIVEKMGEQTTGYVLAFSYYKDKRNETRLKEMVQNADDMQSAALTLRERQKEKLAAAQVESSHQIEDKLKKADDANRMIKWFLDTRKNEKEVIISKDEKYRDMVDEQIAQILNLGQDLKTRFTSETNIQRIDEALLLVTAYKQAYDQFVGLMNQQDVADKKMVVAAQLAQDTCMETQGEQKQKMLSQIVSAKSFMIGGAAVTMFFGLLFGFFITRSIKRGVAPIIDGLTEGADHVASGSGEVASASQTLAAGASQQAAGIEEISSSMELMASMTKQNAENAGQADLHMQENKQVVIKANDSMDLLTNSIGEISTASDETSKIIKTIDEIAFQTNLLALNAAVEAARAGEAGAGFAVVADEVRNLAMRAAEAAKNTSSLIESIVKKVHEGSGLVGTTSQAFCEVTEGLEKAGVLVTEIAAASGEQSKGIEQVNAAIFEVDKVTQQNAANAEQSASASEEMSAQAAQMEKFVQDLIKLMGKRSTSNALQIFGKPKEQKKMTSHNAASLPAKRLKAPEGTQGKTKEVSSQQVLPMEDTDFEDF